MLSRLLFKSRCYNGGTKHKFVALWNEECGAPVMDDVQYLLCDAVAVAQACSPTKRTLAKCVCDWCGKEAPIVV